jgi:hypothetical protein
VPRSTFPEYTVTFALRIDREKAIDLIGGDRFRSRAPPTAAALRAAIENVTTSAPPVLRKSRRATLIGASRFRVHGGPLRRWLRTRASRADDPHVRAAAAQVLRERRLDLLLRGLALVCSNAAACMIIPLMQYPHCTACSSMNAFCNGCGLPACRVPRA